MNREDNSDSSDTGDLLLQTMGKKDLLKILDKISNHLEKRYDVSKEEQFKQVYENAPGKTVPVEVFGTELSPSEAIIKFLKENKKLSYHEIAVELNRDERGIWGGYQRAKKKMSQAFSIEPTTTIPISIFENRDLSILENVVMFLKDSLNWKLVQIARTLNKKSTTISTAYSRAKEKLGSKQPKRKGGDREKKMEVREE